MHKEQAFSMHLMTSGLAGSRPRCSIALPSLSILTYLGGARLQQEMDAGEAHTVTEYDALFLSFFLYCTFQ